MSLELTTVLDHQDGVGEVHNGAEEHQGAEEHHGGGEGCLEVGGDGGAGGVGQVDLQDERQQGGGAARNCGEFHGNV